MKKIPDVGYGRSKKECSIGLDTPPLYRILYDALTFVPSNQKYFMPLSVGYPVSISSKDHIENRKHKHHYQDLADFKIMFLLSRFDI